MWKDPQAAQKGPDARRRPPAAREAYSLYVERATKGANSRASEESARPSDGLSSDDHADGPFSAAGSRYTTRHSSAWRSGHGRAQPAAFRRPARVRAGKRNQ